MKNELEKDYQRCEKVIKRASKSFYKAFSTIKDQSKREAIYAVYAYCRYSDDIADQIKSTDELLKLKADLDAFIEFNQTPNYIFRALSDVRSKFYPKDFDFKPYQDMLEGHMMDFMHQGYESLEALYHYAMKVASSVGQMLIYILAPEGDIKKLNQVAVDLGIAMQLTNILRDIGEDYKMGRIYLPRDLLNAYHYTNDMLHQGIINTSFIQVFESIASKAMSFYDKALQNFDAFPEDSRKSLHYATVIYREIIEVCRKNGYKVFNKRQKVSDLRKIELILEVNKLYES